MADPRRRDAIWTHSGRVIRPLDPRPEDIDIEDIAHALSMQCRFTGHTSNFYSVAQHSVHVSELVPDNLMLWGLLHDASEAYLSDMARPVKKTEPLLTVYKEIEERLMLAVAEKFGLPWPEPKEVKRADDIMVLAEMRDLMPSSMNEYAYREGAVAREEPVIAWSHARARIRFLHRFKELT